MGLFDSWLDKVSLEAASGERDLCWTPADRNRRKDSQIVDLDELEGWGGVVD